MSKAKTNSTTNANKDQESTIEKRAAWEGFEYRVPCEGTVRVENVSYGDESDDHTHVVNVEGGTATDCTCSYNQYNESCKHRIAVDDTPPVIAAATPEVEIDTENAALPF